MPGEGLPRVAVVRAGLNEEHEEPELEQTRRRVTMCHADTWMCVRECGKF